MVVVLLGRGRGITATPNAAHYEHYEQDDYEETSCDDADDGQVIKLFCVVDGHDGDARGRVDILGQPDLVICVVESCNKIAQESVAEDINAVGGINVGDGDYALFPDYATLCKSVRLRRYCVLVITELKHECAEIRINFVACIFCREAIGQRSAVKRILRQRVDEVLVVLCADCEK